MVLGQRGVNLIERVVLEMGCIWNQTGAIDVGIDGTIELCDPATRAALGTFVHVQSKATDGKWERETSTSFDYTCRPQDLDYWLQGNAPVVLIVSRPSTGEAYWISVKDHFRDAAVRQSRRAHFDKRSTAFTADAYAALVALGRPPDVGLYLASTPRQERLLSNLLEVRSFAPRLYLAETRLRRRPEVWQSFSEVDERCPAEFLLSDKRMLSFHDLREHPWSRVCDRSTVEDFAADEWAFSTDPDRRREFVQLLNNALQEKAYPVVQPWYDLKLFAWIATLGAHRRCHSMHARQATG
jgi:hypothetical protein